MQTVIGRLTANAVIKETKDGRKLVAFTMAQNDRFRVKGSDQVQQLTNYFNCSYWLGTSVAQHLTKGMLVEVNGRVGFDVWKDKEGDAKGCLTLHVQSIQMHGKAGVAGNQAAGTETTEASTEIVDDLPF